MKPAVIGFKKEAALVRGVAKALGVKPQLVEPKQYRAGEWAVFAPAEIRERVVVAGNVWEDPTQVFQLALLLKAVKTAGAKKVFLIAPWMAYGRQDKSIRPGETPASQVVADLLLSTGVNKIVTLDVHSPIFADFFKGKLISVQPIEAAVAFARGLKVTAVAAPDRGAQGRAKVVAEKLRAPFIQIEKRRLSPARVISHLASGNPKGQRVLFIDDIVDSGGTLIQAARMLKQKGAVSVHAYLSHAVDIKKFARNAKKYGIVSAKAAFDHKTRRFFIPLRLLVLKNYH